MSLKNFNYWIVGAGTVFELGPSPTKWRAVRVHNSQFALARDWAAISHDVSKSVNNLIRTLPLHEREEFARESSPRIAPSALRKH